MRIARRIKFPINNLVTRAVSKSQEPDNGQGCNVITMEIAVEAHVGRALG